MSSTSSSPPKKAPPRKPSRRDATDTRGANRLANGPNITKKTIDEKKRAETRERATVATGSAAAFVCAYAIRGSFAARLKKWNS